MAFSNEVCTSIPPLYVMKPSFRNLFMKKLTRARVVPIISASVSWLILAITGSGLPLFTKIRQQQEQPREPFLARIEQLIDEVCFNADGPIQEIGNEHLGKRRLNMDHANDRRFLQPHDDRVRHCRDRRNAPRLSGQAHLSEEIVRSENRDDCFLAL